MEFQVHPTIIEAERWYPGGRLMTGKVEPYQTRLSGSQCTGCDRPMEEHGWINDGTFHGARVGPGYWVAVWPSGALRVYSPEDFNKLCKPVKDPDPPTEDYFLSGGWRK